MPLRVAWKNVLRLLKLGFFPSFPLIAVVWYLGRAKGREQNTCALLRSFLPVMMGHWRWYLCPSSQVFCGALYVPSCTLNLFSSSCLMLLRHLVLYNKELEVPVSPWAEVKGAVCARKPLWSGPARSNVLCASERGQSWVMATETGPSKEATFDWRSEVFEKRGWILNLSLTTKLQCIGIVLAVW